MKNMKVTMVSDTGVGKTCLLLRYSWHEFPTELVPKLLEGYSANVMCDDVPVQLKLGDTACGDEYDRLRPLSYTDTTVFALCFSCVDPPSFNNIKEKWIPEILQHMPNTPYILVATKTDLREDENIIEGLLATHHRGPISQREGDELASEIGAYAYLECSSLRGRGIAEVFYQACKAVLPPRKLSAPTDNNSSRPLSNCVLQ